MNTDELNSLISNLEWQGFSLSESDIEWLETFDDPGEAHNEFMACNAYDYRQDIPTKAALNR